MALTPDDMLSEIIGMTDSEMTTLLAYVAGNVAFRINRAGLNVTYPPAGSDDLYIGSLIRQAGSFTHSVQRQIEFMRKHRH